MKKLASLFFLMFPLFSFAQQGIVFKPSSLSELQAKAKAENKIIFIDCYTVWCRPCKLMEKNVFTKKEVGEYYNATFIPAKFDMEKEEGLKIAEAYNVTGYPTYLFIDSEGKMLHRYMGELSPEDFIQLAKNAQDPDKQVGNLQKRYEKGERSVDFIKSYVDYLLQNAGVNKAEEVAKEYFAQKKDNNYAQEEVEILFGLASTTDSELYKRILADKEKLKKIVGDEQFEGAINSIIFNTIKEKSINHEALTIDDAYYMKEAQKYIPKEAAKAALNEFKLDFFLNNGKVDEFEKQALSYYKDYSKFTSMDLGPVSSAFAETVNTQSSLLTVIKWAQKVAKEEPGYSSYKTLAMLYNKTGNLLKAKEFAKKAKSKAGKEDDVTEVQTIIDTK